MPNWNFTAYRVTGNKEKCADLYNKIKSLEDMKESLCENDFGKLWCGNLVHLLGGDENDYKNTYCRGHITGYELHPDGDLLFNVESAWSELNQFRHFIEKAVGGIKIYHSSEEPGMELFRTNDKDGKYFPQKYYLDISDDNNDVYETEYPESLDEAKKILSEKFPETNFDFDNFDDVKKAIDDIHEKNEMVYITFEPYVFVDD